MLTNVKPEDILFLDIETVPAVASYNALDQAFQRLWDKKSKQFRTEEQTAAEVYDRAGIYAEFGKIICISVGLIKEKDPFSFRLKSFFGDDEKALLTEFSEMLKKFSRNRDVLLCAHNGKEFDYPYIARRMLINGLQLPFILNIAGKKPWEIPHLDTMELWKFGDFKHYTSLALLAAVFGIQTPKDDINGADVARVYWEDHDMERIVHYCQKDVLTVAQLFLKYQSKPLLNDDQIVIIP